MEAVKGIDLKEELSEAEKWVLTEVKANIQEALRKIHIDIYKLIQEERGARKQAAECLEKIDKLRKTVAKIEAGDWALIPEKFF